VVNPPVPNHPVRETRNSLRQPHAASVTPRRGGQCQPGVSTSGDNGGPPRHPKPVCHQHGRGPADHRGMPSSLWGESERGWRHPRHIGGAFPSRLEPGSYLSPGVYARAMSGCAFSGREPRRPAIQGGHGGTATTLGFRSRTDLSATPRATIGFATTRR
jgi:hypothetical protein